MRMEFEFLKFPDGFSFIWKIIPRPERAGITPRQRVRATKCQKYQFESQNPRLVKKFPDVSGFRRPVRRLYYRLIRVSICFEPRKPPRISMRRLPTPPPSWLRSRYVYYLPGKYFRLLTVRFRPL